MTALNGNKNLNENEEITKVAAPDDDDEYSE